MILSGALEHKDSTGNAAVIRPGEVQRMTAGKGIQHSEFNHLEDEDTHLLQIWILPIERGLAPGYEQKDFREQWQDEPLMLVASQDGRKGSVTVHQDLNLYMGRTTASQLNIPMKKDRGGWIQVTKGNVAVGDTILSQGDGAAFSDIETVQVGRAGHGRRVPFFDLA